MLKIKDVKGVGKMGIEYELCKCSVEIRAELPVAIVEIMRNSQGASEKIKGLSHGSDPFDALYNAIKNVTGLDFNPESLEIKVVKNGSGPKSIANFRMLKDEAMYDGSGEAQETYLSAGRAVLDALNSFLNNRYTPSFF